MKILYGVSEQVVWNHWMIVEHHNSDKFRGDIRNILPNDMFWFLAELEESDLNKLFIISSSDWTDISRGTFKVTEVAKNVYNNSDNPDTQRLSKDIQKKINFINSGNKLDSSLILVAPTFEGPFTLIEGNRRSVAFSILGTIVGCNVFLGISPDIVKYKWARKSVL